TSVPGLPAKPLIDIVLAVPDTTDEPSYVPDLTAAGYRLTIREPDWFEHRLFKGPDTNINLHTFTAGTPEIARMLRFRDWLRSHDDDRDRYAAVKRDPARRRPPAPAPAGRHDRDRNSAGFCGQSVVITEPGPETAPEADMPTSC
ncbi:MAG TPA: GrpB family protein, partial [Streptosporangiaceae bacterium]|nr:GrpB family protein [Streptosporangiaceae bacterium]